MMVTLPRCQFSYAYSAALDIYISIIITGYWACRPVWMHPTIHVALWLFNNLFLANYFDDFPLQYDNNSNVRNHCLYMNICRNFPSLYYYKEFPIGTGNHTFGFIFIDTILLCGHSDDFSTELIIKPEDKPLADQQWIFISQALQKSR